MQAFHSVDLVITRGVAELPQCFVDRICGHLNWSEHDL